MSDSSQISPNGAPLGVPRRIVLIGFPGAQSLDLIGPLEVFSMANNLGAADSYDVVLASPTGGDIVCNSGVCLGGAVALADLHGDIDTLLVAGGDWRSVSAACEDDLPSWLSAEHRRARRVGSVCSGSFILAAAGLLDGRRATTHWGFSDKLGTFRPAVRLESDAIFVADPPFFTSAGVTAGIDLCLSLVEADKGSQLALAVARNLVLFLRRAGGQAQYSQALEMQSAASMQLRELITELAGSPVGDCSLSKLASRVGMSERTFSRVVKKETGVSPGALIEALRVDRAKALLEASDWPLARIAERAGFGSVSALHRGFQKRLGATPSQYRDRFGPIRRGYYAG
jgi:transcriptional regulator GlxA family with amidase domain